MLDAGSAKGKVGWEDGLRPVDQEEWRISCSWANLGPETPDHVRELR
jgi:hypothetical protein